MISRSFSARSDVFGDVSGEGEARSDEKLLVIPEGLEPSTLRLEI